MVNLVRLSKVLDRAVDHVWSVQIDIVPWHQGTYDAGEPDPARLPVSGIGSIFRGPDVVVGGGGTSGGFETRVAQADLRLSVEKSLIDQAAAKVDDRVIAGDPYNATYTISRIMDDGSGRSIVHLLLT